MPYLSIVVPTMRVGGLNILFDALAAQRFTDFELVLVDGLRGKRAARVAEEARDRARERPRRSPTWRGAPGGGPVANRAT